MGKLTFKNKILNLITSGFFLVAAIIGLIGLIGVHVLDYLSSGIYYILGIGAVVFAGINMFASFKKNNKKEGNITIIITNIVNIVLGLILFIHIIKVGRGENTYSNDEFWFNPARVFGLICYLEGVQLILVSKFNTETTIKRTIIGIFFITFGAISFIWLKDDHIAYSLDAILFFFGLYYLYVGLKPVINKKKNSDKEDIDALPKKKEKKSLFHKEENKKIEKEEVKEITHDTEEHSSIDDLFDE